MVTSPNYIVSIPITFPCPCIFVIKLNMFKDCFFASMYCPSWLWIGFPKDANNHIWLKGEQEVLQEKIRIFFGKWNPVFVSGIFLESVNFTWFQKCSWYNNGFHFRSSVAEIFHFLVGIFIERAHFSCSPWMDCVALAVGW